MEDNPFQSDSDPKKGHESSLNEGMTITNMLLTVEALYESDEWRSGIREYTMLVSYLNLSLKYVTAMLDTEVDYLEGIYNSVSEFQKSMKGDL